MMHQLFHSCHICIRTPDQNTFQPAYYDIHAITTKRALDLFFGEYV
jgi:hypothetical protein